MQKEEFFYNKPIQLFMPNEIIDLAHIAIELNQYEHATLLHKFGNNINNLLDSFFSQTNLHEVEVLVIGPTDLDYKGFEHLIDLIISHHIHLKNLKAIFFGNIDNGFYLDDTLNSSFIKSIDIRPLLKFYPDLEEIKIRGSGALLNNANHEKLRKLIIESTSIRVETIEELATCYFPDLKYFEIWLGSDEANDYLSKNIDKFNFKNLKQLGIKNTRSTNGILSFISNSPIFYQLEVLDISYGTLSDYAIDNIVSSGKFSHLKTLRLDNNQITESGIAQLKTFSNQITTDNQNLNTYSFISE